MIGAAALVLAALLALPAAAGPPARSSPPEARPDLIRVQTAAGSGARATAQEAGAVRLSPRPETRPENLVRRTTVRAGGFRAPVTPHANRVERQGRLCGSRRLRGEAAPAIPAKLPGCGLTGGVRVFSVDGVALSRPATMDCTTAKALETWVRKGLKPAVGRTGGGVAELKVAAHYVCRTRNHRRGAPISEHGKGKAIDISGIALENGAVLSVLTGWNDRAQGPILRRAHRAACGPFGTVLGPDADRHHRTHFHFDTARHRSGPYCR